MIKQATIVMLSLVLTSIATAADDAIDRVVETYGAAWNETDTEARMQLLEASWAENGTYTDPNTQVQGRERLSAYITDFQAQFKDTRLVLTGGVDAHHDKLRFSWQVVNEDGSIALQGMDFGSLDEDGRLEEIAGFFDTAE